MKLVKNYVPKGLTATVKIGPFLSATDGVTPVDNLGTGATKLLAADILVSKNDGAFAGSSSIADPVLIYDDNGFYQFVLNGTDNDTAGKLKLSINASGCLPVMANFEVRRTFATDLTVTKNNSTGDATIDPSDFTYEGENQLVTITLGDDFDISTFTVNGVDKKSEVVSGGVGIYKYGIQNVAAPLEVVVVFPAPA